MRARAVRTDQLAGVRNAAWVDTTRHPYVTGEIAWVPVREGLLFDCEIPERHEYSGRGYFMLGDAAVIHGNRPTDQEVEGIVRFRRPRGVLWIESLTDVTRTRPRRSCGAMSGRYVTGRADIPTLLIPAR